MPYATQTPEQRKAANRLQYARRLGLTVEQLDAKQAEAREMKERQKQQRAIELANKPKKRCGPNQHVDAMWQRLKKKHAKWAGTRLEKSEKPPVPLIHMDEA